MINGTILAKGAKWADITSMIVTLFVLFIFLQYFRAQVNLDSPLIPEWTTAYVMKPWMIKGSILSFGLLTGLSLRLAGLVRAQLFINIGLIVTSLVFNHVYSFIMSLG